MAHNNNALALPTSTTSIAVLSNADDSAPTSAGVTTAPAVTMVANGTAVPNGPALSVPSGNTPSSLGVNSAMTAGIAAVNVPIAAALNQPMPGGAATTVVPAAAVAVGGFCALCNLDFDTIEQQKRHMRCTHQMQVTCTFACGNTDLICRHRHFFYCPCGLYNDIDPAKLLRHARTHRLY